MDAPADAAPPPDTFLSMRVGDVQKQSRLDLEKSRTYRFPPAQSDFGRVARIEVFKRIGNISVDLEQCKGGERLEIPCVDLDRQFVALNVEVKDIEAKVRPASREKKTRTKHKFDEAQQYLMDFGLEDVLAEAVRQVIHEKPDDPFAYLSNNIIKQGAAMPRKERTLRPAAVERVLPGSVLSTDIPDLSKEIAATTKPRPNNRSVVAGVPPVQVLTGTGIPWKALMPFRAYYTSNFRGSHLLEGSGLYESFASPQKPAADAPLSVSTVKPMAPSLPQVEEEPVSPGFHKVGALLKPSSNVENDDIPVAVKLVNFLKQTNSEIKKKPSVATWIQDSPSSRSASKANAINNFTNMCWDKANAGSSDPRSSSGMPGSPIQLRPSVATWHQATPRKKANPISLATETTDDPFHLRPSVGTWLQSDPPQVERPWFYQERNVGEHGEYVRGLQQVISEKDAELERLKAQLAAVTGGAAAAAKPDKLDKALPDDDLRLAASRALLRGARSGNLRKCSRDMLKDTQAAGRAVREKASRSLLQSASEGSLMRSCISISAASA